MAKPARDFYCVFCTDKNGSTYLMDFFTTEDSAQKYIDSYRRLETSFKYFFKVLSRKEIENSIFKKGGN